MTDTHASWTALDLDPHHLQVLQDSGISPEVAAARGYRTVRTPDDVPAEFSAAQRKLVPALLIPVFGVEPAEAPIAHELRPDNPRTDGRAARNGKPPKARKYEFPAGAAKRLDVPRAVQPALGDPSTALWITEGARKADAAASRGMVAVSIAGVWSFRSSNVHGGKVELPDFDAVALNGRDVFVAFDSDVTVKPEVKRALHRLKGVLARRGARVHVVVLPAGAKGSKQGLDDVIAAGADEAYLVTLADPEFLADDQRAMEQRLYDFVSDGYELGQDPGGNGFAIPAKGPRVVRMLYTGRPSLELEAPAEFHRAEADRPVPSRRVVRDVMALVEADCLAAPRSELHLRTAPCRGGVIVDLGDETGRVVAVDASDWTVVDKPPAWFPLFRRTNRVTPLPEPQRGGALDELRGLLNVTDETWPLILGWLVAAPFGWIARPWLYHTGPQGSGKTDAALLALSVLDPRQALTTAPRRGDRSDPAGLASASYLLGFDNLSHISDELSDWLCSLVTGGEDSRRILHTTATVMSLEFMRTGVLTGISLSGLKPDLLERLIPVEFGRIASEQRRLHGQITQAFEALRPRLLGALLDAVSLVLRHLPEVDPAALGVPRMADYAAILRAYDLGTGTTDTFEAYRTVVHESFDEAANEDPVAAVVLDYMSMRESVTLEPADLYQSLTIHRLSMGQADDAYWPANARAFSTALLRLTAMLERQCRITRHRANGRRLITIERRDANGDSETVASLGSSLVASLAEPQVRPHLDLYSDASDAKSLVITGENNITNLQDPRLETQLSIASESIVTDVTSVQTDPVTQTPASPQDPHANLAEVPPPANAAPLPETVAAPRKVPTADCAGCGEPMRVVQPGQTVHPSCPGGADDPVEREDAALELLAGELGAEHVPASTPQWVSVYAKKQLAIRRKAQADAKKLGLPGLLQAAGVGSVSAKVTWDIPNHRQALKPDQVKALAEVARKFAARHREAHRSAASATAAVSLNYVHVVLTRTDLDAFLAELVLAVKGAP